MRGNRYLLAEIIPTVAARESARTGDEWAVTVAAAGRHAGGTILSERRLHFRKDGDHWRGAEYPDRVILRGGGYELDG